MISVEYKKRLIEKKRIGILLNILCYSILGLVFFVLNSTFIQNININPFAPALLVGLLFCGINNYYIFISFSVGSILSDLSFANLYVVLNTVAVCMVLLLINKKLRKTQHIVLSFLYYLICLVALIYNHYTDLKSLLGIGVGVVLGMIFLYCSICILWATIVRGFNFRLNLDEKICGAVVLIVFSMGLSGLNLFGIEFVKIFATLSILICTTLFNSTVTVCVGAIIGVGCSLFYFNYLLTN